MGGLQFLGDEIQRILREATCPRCGSGLCARSDTSDGPHFAKLACLACGAHLDWIAWPKTETEEKRDRKRSRRYVTRLGEQRCELCLRHENELPPPAKLEVHHVIEKGSGGADEPENLRLYCTACHSLVNWIRTYFGHYHPALEP